MTKQIFKKAARNIAFFAKGIPKESKKEALRRLRQRYSYAEVTDLENTVLSKERFDLLFVLLPENNLFLKMKYAVYSLIIPAKEKLIYRKNGRHYKLSLKEAILFRLNEPVYFFLTAIAYFIIFTPAFVYLEARKLKIRTLLLGVLKIYALSLNIKFFKKRSKEQVGRILIVRNDGIGDAVLSLSALRSMRNSYPGAKIYVLASTLNHEIFSQDNLVDGVLILNHKSCLLDKFRAVVLIKKMRFDLALDLRHGDTLTEAIIIFLAGIPEKIGYAVGKHGFLFTRQEHLEDPDNTHETDITLNIAKASGASVSQREFLWTVGDSEKGSVSRFFKEIGIENEDLLIGVNPGGNNSNQRWGVEKFSSLCDRIIEDYHAKIIFTGSLQEQLIVQQILDNMYKKDAVSTAGRFNLRELFALIERCSLFISNNTGPLHMACALRIPTISINGPTVFNRWEPLGDKNLALKKELPCQPCGLPECLRARCMQMISVDEAFACASTQLKKINDEK